MFRDRAEAGLQLAQKLGHLHGQDVVVVGLPRGGVPVAAEVARCLCAPLDVILVRKLGVPHQPELAMGAIGERGVRVVNDEVIATSRVTEQELAAVEARERSELKRRAVRFRAVRGLIPLDGRVVVVVDDGIATGSTARAACQVATAMGAARVVLAVPVAPAGWTRRLQGAADEFVAISTPEPFYAIGQFYTDFDKTSDDEVVACLRDAATLPEVLAASSRLADDPPVRDEEVAVRAGEATLAGHLTVPERSQGVVIFAHGSGSSRHSARTRHVADVLNRAGLATLLFDLLTVDEELDRGNVFDIALLVHRLAEVTTWVRTQPEVAGLPVGYFGASTGAAAALAAAARPGSDIAAVVSQGGRPDLAGPLLDAVDAPTLLIVGGNDRVVLDLNRQARRQLHCPSELTVVASASHLFEERGTLQAAAEVACDWFLEHIAPVAASA